MSSDPSNPRRRSNAVWVASLRGGGQAAADAAIELSVYLRGALGRVVGTRVPGSDLDDLVQEAIVRVCEGLDDFRGDSAFTTWATAIGIRIAYTEIRRRHVRECRQTAFDDVQRSVEGVVCPSTKPPDATASLEHAIGVLRHAIDTELTPKQRLAITAELGGLPTIEIATRMSMTQNALYKLTHDARKKLRAAMEARGYDGESIHSIVEEASR